MKVLIKRQNLEYVLKEYYENDYSKEDLKKAIVFNLLHSFKDNYFYTNDALNDEYVDNFIKSMEEDRKFIKDGFNYNDYEIKPGDYHTLAIAILETQNQEENDKYISEGIGIIDDIISVLINIIFLVLYMIVVLRFVFLNIFDKNNFIKDIIKFALLLAIIFVLNIIITITYESVINNLGKNYYSLANGASIINYGIIDLTTLLIIFVGSVVINSLINIREIINYFKGGNVKKKCNCGKDCKCGCNEGKECTCNGECKCGCHEGKKCTCDDNCKCGCHKNKKKTNK